MKKTFLKVIIAVFLVGIISYNAFDIYGSVSVLPVISDTDIARLEYFDDFQVAEIEKNIDRLVSERLHEEELIRLEEERKASYENLMKQLKDGTITYRRLFNDTMIVGDSLMHGLSLYNILDSSNMITMVSASLYHLDENVGNIIRSAPEKLVLHYGINMLINSDSSLNNFIGMYKRIIKEIQSALPDTEIYISSIFNVADRVKHSYSAVDKYNAALDEMCEELNITFVDNSSFLGGSSEYYGSDGIHVGKDFYSEKWLPHLFYSTLD